MSTSLTSIIILSLAAPARRICCSYLSFGWKVTVVVAVELDVAVMIAAFGAAFGTAT